MRRFAWMLAAIALRGQEWIGELDRADTLLDAGKYEESAATARAVAERHKNDDRARARALNIAGAAALYLARYDEAAAEFRTALDAARRTGDKNREIGLLNNLGNVDFFAGRYSDALARYTEAEHAVANSPAEPWLPRRRRLTLTNLAVLYEQTGRYRKALEYLERAMPRNHAAPNRAATVRERPPRATQEHEAAPSPTEPRPQGSGQRQARLQSSSHGPPRAAQEDASLRPALPNRARQQAVSSPPPNADFQWSSDLSSAEQAQVLVNQGTLYRQLGDAPKALEYYKSAAELFRKSRHADGEIAVLQSTGIVEALDFRAYEKAAQSFAEALRLAERGGNARRIAVARLLSGVAFEKLGKRAEAATHFASAADTASRAALPDEHWEALFGQGRLAGSAEESMRLFEQSIGVIESMRGGLDAPALRAEFLANKREVYDAAIEILLRAGTPQLPRIFTLMEQSRARALRDKVGAAATPQLKDVQSRLNEGAVLAEVWTSRSNYAVLMITRASATLHHGSWNPREAERFAKSLTAPGAAPAPIIPWFARAIPQGTTSLIVSPDGPLHLVPFEAILDDRSSPLITRFPISYVPSAALLRTSTQVSTSLTTPRIAIFAEPLPSEQEPRPLPFSAIEARAIDSLLPGRAIIFTGARNRRANLDGGAGLLHLATHATIDLSDPDLSRIAFSNGEYLYRREIDSINFSRVDLVTLSACDTERGRIVRGEGVQSFSRAFLGAGAKSTVTTLWRIADGPTSEFMKQFYFRLGRGESKVEALRGAKLAMLRSNTAFADPYFWAAFVLNGDGATPVPPLDLSVPIVAILALAAAYYNRRNAPSR